MSTVERQADLIQDLEMARDFLRDQIADLSQQIRSVSAPRTRQQMQRLLNGILRGDDWRNGTWR